ncbi:hypothetical protein HDV62DRAFT_66559 [Trichoderma sp. SZMC 28011]
MKRGIYLSTKKKQSKQTHSSPVPFQTPCKIIKAGLSPPFSQRLRQPIPLNDGLSSLYFFFCLILSSPPTVEWQVVLWWHVLHIYTHPSIFLVFLFCGNCALFPMHTYMRDCH